jgi:hypothetical protein
MTAQADRERALTELLDRQAIIDCIHRYTRGVDRLDEEIILSAFHEDAQDFHGLTPRSPTEFIAWYSGKPARLTSQHYVTNEVIAIDGDTAHGEIYWTAVGRPEVGTDMRTSGGRYVARFDRRDGEWRIAVWVVITEWVSIEDGSELAQMLAGRQAGHRDRSDISYLRPLEGAAVGAETPVALSAPGA